MYIEVAKHIDSLALNYLVFLENICQIDSESHNKNGINQVAQYIITYEDERNYRSSLKNFDRAGDCLCLDFLNDSNKPFVVFSAHMDTVFEKSAFKNPPITRDDKYIYGPGVCDCKGGIAMALLTMAALKESGFSDLNIRLLLQSDEEVSSSLSNKETIKYICQMAKGCKAFFNLEPKYPGMLTLERGGIFSSKFTVIGKSAHSSKKELGANAIDEAVYKISQILQNAPKSISVNCGRIEGGSASNVVPDKCVFYVECRAEKLESFNEAKVFLENIAKKQFVLGTKTDFEIVSERIPMELTDFNLELFEKIKEISQKYGFDTLKTRKSLGGSDASYTTEVGIPTADGMGMVGFNLHSIEEKAEIESLATGAKLLAAIVIELAQGEKYE